METESCPQMLLQTLYSTYECIASILRTLWCLGDDSLWIVSALDAEFAIIQSHNLSEVHLFLKHRPLIMHNTIKINLPNPLKRTIRKQFEQLS
jgi:hypothetical protein